MNYQAELDKTIKNLKDKPKLLLHACCGPCSSYVMEYLASIFDITILYYNPNIYPQEEYERRLQELKDFLPRFSPAVENKIKLVEMNFTTGSIFRKLIGFMMPILGALLLQTMYGAVDILVVGWFGTDAGISAVSTGSSFINMIVFILNGLAMGVTVLMGRYIGEKNEERLGKVIGGVIVTFLAIAAVMTVLLLVFAPELSNVMQAPKDAMDKTIVYIRICGGGIVFIIGYNLISSIFRGIGNSRLPLLFVGIACAVNVVLDLVFVAVFRWDVAGAAFATVIAQAVSLILSVLVCTKIDLPFHIQKSNLCFSGEVQKFLALGLPIAFQEFLTQFSFMCLLSFVNGMGSTEAIRLARIWDL